MKKVLALVFLGLAINAAAISSVQAHEPGERGWYGAREADEGGGWVVGAVVLGGILAAITRAATSGVCPASACRCAGPDRRSSAARVRVSGPADLLRLPGCSGLRATRVPGAVSVRATRR